MAVEVSVLENFGREAEGVEIISLTNDYVNYLSTIQKEATKNVGN